MKKRNIFIAFLVLCMFLLCSYFVPRTQKSKYCDVQAPAVSEYIRTIEGHKYVVIVATNINPSGYTDRANPSISVTCVHSESCPCKSKK